MENLRKIDKIGFFLVKAMANHRNNYWILNLAKQNYNLKPVKADKNPGKGSYNSFPSAQCCDINFLKGANYFTSQRSTLTLASDSLHKKKKQFIIFHCPFQD